MRLLRIVGWCVISVLALFVFVLHQIGAITTVMAVIDAAILVFVGRTLLKHGREQEMMKARMKKGSPQKSMSPPLRAKGHDADDVLSRYVDSTPRSSSDRKIPPPPAQRQGSWVKPGSTVEVKGISIDGGMLYVGHRILASNGQTEPALIDPLKSVANYGDYTASDMGYYPSYSDISPSQRRAYLLWLQGGRNDPRADIGFVFLFFYGLERRVIVDGGSKDADRSDWPEIATELRRLLSIYGVSNRSFGRYGSALLEWVEAGLCPENSYSCVVAPSAYSGRLSDVPLSVLVPLGNCARDGVPVPVDLALAWVKTDPEIPLRTPAVRCGDAFERLFASAYTKEFGAGMVLPRNKTRIRKSYRPASAGLGAGREIAVTLPDIPNVAASSVPRQKIQGIVDAVTSQLDGYSRFLAKNPERPAAVDGCLLLPPAVWPADALALVEQLRHKIESAGGAAVLLLAELTDALGVTQPLNKERSRLLATSLEALGVGISPRLGGPGRQIKPDESVAIFALPPELIGCDEEAPAYQVATVTIQLAVALALADGDLNQAEMDHLATAISMWGGLTQAHIVRLQASLKLLAVAPVSLAALKKQLEQLDASAKEVIAAFMATMAQSDGCVSPDEIKLLQRIYKTLGVDPQRVFVDVHAASTSSSPAAMLRQGEETNSAGAPGFTLDHAKIAALQEDTARVSALMARIFVDDALPAASADGHQDINGSVPQEAQDADDAGAKGGSMILGLDLLHSRFARMILARDEWSRAELSDLADDLGLMLEGALETVNEAAFDAHDAPLIEGDDPFSTNTELAGLIC